MERMQKRIEKLNYISTLENQITELQNNQKKLDVENEQKLKLLNEKFIMDSGKLSNYFQHLDAHLKEHKLNEHLRIMNEFLELVTGVLEHCNRIMTESTSSKSIGFEDWNKIIQNLEHGVAHFSESAGNSALKEFENFAKRFQMTLVYHDVYKIVEDQNFIKNEHLEHFLKEIIDLRAQGDDLILKIQISRQNC